MPCLVIQLARMGDLLQTKRLLLGLAQTDDVHLLVDHSLAGFANLIFPFVTVHGITAHGSGSAVGSVLNALLSELAELRKFDFNTIYNLNYSGLNMALSTLWKPDKLRGYWLDSGQNMRSSWLGLAFRWSRERRTAPLNLMDLWGMLAPLPTAPNQVNPKPEPKGGGLGVVLAGRMARRSIPPEFLAAHITAVSRRMALSIPGEAAQRMKWPAVYLIGGKNEQSAAKEVMRALPASVLNNTSNLAGKTSLPELAEHVSRLDRLLTPDTGAMHLAAHFGVPVEAFFLSSAWAYETGPYGEGHTVWQALTPCLPCLESQPCPFEIKCLNAFRDPKFLKILSKAELSNPLKMEKILEADDEHKKTESIHTDSLDGFNPADTAGKPELKKNETAPEGILALKSGFDELGVIYNSFLCTAPQTAEIIDPDNQRRIGLRRLTAEYSCEKLMESVKVDATNIRDDNRLYEYFFHESDWILPKER